MYIKKGYQTEECLRARKETAQRRRQNADEKYRRLFYELGLDENFEYIQFEGKDKIRLKCKRCGVEKLRTKCVFVGKQEKLFCRGCGNGTLTFSPFVDEVLAFYAGGHSINETCERFGVGKYQLMDWAKRRKVSNGRSLTDVNAEKARAAALATLPDREKKFIVKVEARGFEYLGGYTRKDCFIKVKCKTCGEVSERSTQPFDDGKAVCVNCKRLASVEKHVNEKMQKQIERERRKAEKLEANPLGLSPYQLERQKVLDIQHTCKICGKQYTIRSYMKSINTKYVRDSGFCSAFCRDKAKHDAQLRNSKKYKAQGKSWRCNGCTRARKLGLPFEEGITKKKLLKRDGDRCAICSLPLQMDGDFRAPLYWSVDHIIPLAKGIVNGKGGHTWDNVQLAHRQCNSAKRDLIGKEWNNGNG